MPDAMTHPLWDHYDGDGERPAQGETPARAPLTLRQVLLANPATIPPREWLYGTMLIRRYVTVLVAPGGVGKTALTFAIGCALARGRQIIGDWVFAQTNVLFCWLEDPGDEFDRRLAATAIKHGLSEDDINGRIYMAEGRERRLVMAKLGPDGMEVVYPDKDALKELIIQHQIGAVVVDPFVNSHELDENSNPQVNAAARAWAELANECNCAVLLVHHTKKGAIAGDAEGGRGAKALVDAARAAFTIAPMSTEEAEKFGISAQDRRRYVRLDDAKANLSPPAEKARWLHLDSIPLGNGGGLYPNGDNVQAIESWDPPSVWTDLAPEDLNRVLDVIAEGPEMGSRYTSSKRGRSNDRWAGHALVEMLELEEAQAAQIIKTWVRNGLLVEEEYDDRNQRKTLKGVRVIDAKRPS